MPGKTEEEKDTAASKIKIELTGPTEDEILQHWLLIADRIRQLEEKKQSSANSESE